MPRSKLRRAAGTLLLLTLSSVLALAAAEAGVRRWNLFSSAREAAGQPAAAPGIRPSKTVLHPYRGWSNRASRPTPPGRAAPRTFPSGERTDWYLAHNRFNAFGFRSAIEDYRRLSDDDFVIGVFGGSVAEFLSVLGGDAIVRSLTERRPDLAGRIEVVNLSTPGYKQPQQLMVLAEMLVLGLPFDVVLNVDGFNEVAYGAGNARQGRHPIFPSVGPLLLAFGLATGTMTAEEHALSAEVLVRKRGAAELRRWLESSASLGRLELARTVVGWRVMAAERRSVEAEAELQELSAAEPSETMAHLSDPCLGRECWEVIADVWQRSSVAMGALARDAGALYVHVLQPNQYVPGSKPLSDAETEHAYEEHRRATVATGYSHLQRRVGQLPARGVRFRDLTMLFAEFPETLYRDPCCHYNWKGNQILGDAIGRVLAEELQTGRPAESTVGELGS